ncbi:MAG: hypothetical protein MJD61_08555 [Proteobacteria bacterium]|nr:hypothetical protein [Pseudomonadota bacterium]
MGQRLTMRYYALTGALSLFACDGMGRPDQRTNSPPQSHETAASVQEKPVTGLEPPPPGAVHDVPRSAAGTACEQPEGCYRLALVRQRQRSAASLAHALGLFEQACERGHLESCYELALMLRDGDGVKVDEARARGLLDQACFGGHPAACDLLGH